MKKLLALIAFSFVFASAASAHEGTVNLTNDSVSCKGVSIYQDGNYRVNGRCDGLVYPYETTYNKYILWGKTTIGGQMVRIAEIDRGYFSGNISSPFDAMYVTAEQKSLVRKASNKQVLSGKVTPFDFDKSQVTTITAKDTTVVPTPATPATPATAGTVVGKIMSSLLVVILVIVGLAIGASLLFRSRGSVSA